MPVLWPVFSFLLHFSLLSLLSASPAYSLNDQGRALLAWKEKLGGADAVLGTWNPAAADPCSWAGVLCNSAGGVVELNISFVDLHGTLPSNFHSLSSLRSLILSSTNISGQIPIELGDFAELTLVDLSNNQISGEIPPAICRLVKLQTLRLHSNSLQGKIPPEIGNLRELVNLTLYDNNISGEIPGSIGELKRLQVFRAGGNPELAGALPEAIGNCSELLVLGLAETGISGQIPSSIGSLKKLQTIAIYTAQLSGFIPEEIAGCVELRSLYLYQNSLSGPIPSRIGELRKLQNLLLWQNNIAGSIPSELGSCSELKVIDLSVNFLTGSIPPSLGSLTALQELQLSSNNLTGSIPPEISACTALTDLELDKNQLSGEILLDFSKLSGLAVFIAWQNSLTGRIPESLSQCRNLQLLDLSFNGFSGEIPGGLFLLQNLTQLLLIDNNLSGAIPPEIGSCSGLFRFRAGGNKLEGLIPRRIGDLQNLNFLDLERNLLSGEIPRAISGCRSLEFLDLHSNSLTGLLPEDLPKGLQVLDVGDNLLEGPINPKIGELNQLTNLVLGRNKFSGFIPPELGSCKKLQLLDLGKNRFSGRIPPELGELPELEISFNLSCNQLFGGIPAKFSRLAKLSSLDVSHNHLAGGLDVLATLENLVTLNISFNSFSGKLPNSIFFRQLPLSDLAGNHGLTVAGGVTAGPTSKTTGIAVKATMSVLIAVSALLTGTAIYMILRRRHFSGEEDGGGGGGMWEVTFYQKLDLSVDDVARSLTSGNIIGTGSSGVVFRVVLPGGETVAVKKMWSSPAPEKKEADEDSFSNEIASLGSIRHRNITRLLGWAANRTTKLLFYSYHPNGSLSSFIHGGGKAAGEWETRYEILLGLAHAVAYLHHDCVPPILHGDVKAMNVLLGPNYEPYLADFGLARPATTGGAARDSRSSPRLAGSYGYIAPEHASAEPITEKSDVYSYGVVLLEVLTGKHPLDPALPGGRPLVQWAIEHWQTKGDPTTILDPRLQGSPETKMQELLQVFAVATLCLSRRPRERPSMNDVVALLEEIATPLPDAPKEAAAAAPPPPLVPPSSSPPKNLRFLGGSSRSSFALSGSFS